MSDSDLHSQPEAVVTAPDHGDAHLATHASELAPVGNTPLVHLRKIAPEGTRTKVFAKIEWMNPAGSVKDRPALWMIRDCEAKGLFDGHRGLLDSTSGNTGIALAQMGAALGYRVTLCIPENASPARQRLLKLLGAELVLTDPLEGDDGARTIAKNLAAEHPDRYIYLDQYSNPMNWTAHYESTAPEIWEQTGGHVTHFCAILGTGGTFTGTSRRLKELNPDIACIAVQPDLAYHGIEGTKHYESSRVPAVFDPSLVDRQIDVSTEEARATARLLARAEGLPAGTSGGANVAAALRLAAEIEDGVIVTVLPDNVMKSIGMPSWDEDQ